MCHRITPLLMEELYGALSGLKADGHARVGSSTAPDAYPGSTVPLFTVDGNGELQAQALHWGFEGPASVGGRLVFNTRLDTALKHLQRRSGMWARPLAQGRCLVPVRAFYESWTIQPRSKGAQVRFRLNGHATFLLAGVKEDNRFSIVTTEPNEAVGFYHTRMPLVLDRGESSIWLGPDFMELADRSLLHLPSEITERPGAQTSLFA